MGFKLRSAAIAPGGPIPAKYTCDGANLSPPLRWTDPPSATKTFALIVEDPSAAPGTGVHWLLYGIADSVRDLPEGIPARDAVERIGTQGTNSFGRVGYGGPCPPPGPRRQYGFTLYALDAPMVLPARVVKGDVLRAMHGHILGRAQLIGWYGRKDPGAGPGGAAARTPAAVDETGNPSLATALTNAMYLIGELTNDDISSHVLAEINLRFAQLEEMMHEVRLRRQEVGWGLTHPRSLALIEAHIGLLNLLIAEYRARPDARARLEAARAALDVYRARIG